MTVGIAALIGTAGLASAGVSAGQPRQASPSSAPSGPPAPSPTSSTPCLECACSTPTATATATVPEAFTNAGYRRAPVATRKVVYTFTFKTDADEKPVFDRTKDVSAQPSAFRSDINGEAVVKDPHGCLLLSFDSRTVDSVVAQSGTYLYNNVFKDARVLPLESQNLKDDNGLSYTRWWFAIAPRYDDMKYWITIEVNVRTR